MPQNWPLGEESGGVKVKISEHLVDNLCTVFAKVEFHLTTKCIIKLKPVSALMSKFDLHTKTPSDMIQFVVERVGDIVNALIRHRETINSLSYESPLPSVLEVNKAAYFQVAVV